MSSADEDRSLASGIPIPQWMRSKTENYGFDPSTLSPPTHEGDFFYIKFPKPQSPQQANVKSINEVIDIKQQAFIRHTDSCKQFIPKIQETIQVQKPKVTKPMGIDDGFKGDGAACGASVVEVAHQMLASQGHSIRTLTRVDTEGNLIAPHVRTRRNSKSLPASPMTSPHSSPRTKRKVDSNLQNRFLMNAESGEKSGSDDNIDKKSGSSWILSSLFAAKDKWDAIKENPAERSLVPSDPDSKRMAKPTADGSSSANQPVNVTMEIEAVAPSPSSSKKTSFFKSKPHLRDLNLLSPTSM